MSFAGISLIPYEKVEEKSNASLEWENDSNWLPEGKFVFRFSVKNYPLSCDSKDETTIHTEENPEGNHIHFILDGKPYRDVFDTMFEARLTSGEHTVLAFLSDANHISLKNKSANFIAHFRTGDIKLMNRPMDMEKPMIYYNTPKEHYQVNEDKLNVVLDYFLMNTDISKEGNYVRATLDDVSSFNLYSWNPYVISGLGEGKHSLRIELRNKDNMLLPGPNTFVEREFTIQDSPSPNE